jgi:hypothetical protein
MMEYGSWQVALLGGGVLTASAPSKHRIGWPFRVTPAIERGAVARLPLRLERVPSAPKRHLLRERFLRRRPSCQTPAAGLLTLRGGFGERVCLEPALARAQAPAPRGAAAERALPWRTGPRLPGLARAAGAWTRGMPLEGFGLLRFLRPKCHDLNARWVSTWVTLEGTWACTTGTHADKKECVRQRCMTTLPAVRGTAASGSSIGSTSRTTRTSPRSPPTARFEGWPLGEPARAGDRPLRREARSPSPREYAPHSSARSHPRCSAAPNSSPPEPTDPAPPDPSSND